MPTTTISNAVPKNLEWWGIGREATPGTLVAPVTTIPLTSGAPNDMANMLVDKALRGDMGEDYNEVLGTELGDFSLSGNVYLDSIGHLLYNLFGDYQAAFATAGTTVGATTVAATAGQTTLTGTAFASGLPIGTLCQVTTTLGGSEIVVLSAISTTTTLTFANTPLRYNHAIATAVTSSAAGSTVNHTFNLLNGGASSLGLSAQAQPPTHTITHNSALASNSTFNPSFVGQRQYGYWCAAGMDFALSLANLFQHSTKGSSFLGADVTTSAYTNSQTDSGAQPDWRFQTWIGGTTSTFLVNNVEDATVSLARQTVPKYGLNGQQQPIEIVRMALGATGKLTFVAQDESPLLTYLAGTTQPLQFGMTNGAALGITFNFNRAIFEAAQLSDPDTMTYDVGFRALMNTGNAGISGARGPVTVTLTNSVATY